MLKKDLPTATAMEDLGAELAQYSPAGTVIFLQGDLGAGKTTLVRGFLRGLGHVGVVKSPTYTLVEVYEAVNPPVFHFDLYRLTAPCELEEMGIRDYFAQNAILLIEWPERAGEILPAPDLSCYIGLLPEGRRVEFKSQTPRGQQILKQMIGSPDESEV